MPPRATDAERTAPLGAGQAIIANWTGTAFNVAYFMGALFAIIVSIVMLRSNVFSKATGYAGLAMGVLMLVPAFAGPVGVVFSLCCARAHDDLVYLAGQAVFPAGRRGAMKSVV